MLESLFQQHFEALIQRYQTLLAEHHYDSAIIPAGQPIRQFLDDMDYPFKVNPHFKAILPLTNNPHSHVIIPQSGRPTVVYYQPVDFWHSVPKDPEGAWVDCVDIKIIKQPNEALSHFPKDGRIILLGQKEGILDAVSFSAANPETIVFPLYWQRATKSDYEIACMSESNRIAVAAHKAAAEEFYRGGSEQQINFAYLAAAGVLEKDMPYSNIVALNENTAILHYTDCQAEQPKAQRSFLIDAGAQVNGYASDITRTYSFDKNDEFAQLISSMDVMQLSLIEQIKSESSYIDLHILAHQKIAQILNDFDIVKMKPEQQVEAGVSGIFFPHGLGHQLGLQVHDVGGHQKSISGGTKRPPEEHGFLRNTRQMDARQVLTIEPGLYFIDSLLNELKSSEFAKDINWKRVEFFKPFGGIRIEDNVVVTEEGSRNLTREHF